MTDLTLALAPAPSAETYAAELAEARALLAAAVEDRGADYVYKAQENADDCMYQTYAEDAFEYDSEYDVSSLDVKSPEQCTGPACLVGHVLYQKQVDPLVIWGMEGNSADTVLRALEVFTHDAVAEAMRVAQATQDAGKPWGEAVAAFEGEIAKYELRCHGREVDRKLRVRLGI